MPLYTIRIYPKACFQPDGRFVGRALETHYRSRSRAIDALLALRKTCSDFVSLTDNYGGNIYPTQRDLGRNRRSA